jgi:alpha-glucosidase (family GH31 glycosyl hydrolase)
MTWDKTRYPDPAGLTKTLHDDLHVKLICSIWPSVGNDTELAHELDAKGLRHKPLHWISKKARIYDAYSANGRAIYYKYIKRGLLDVGVDALWMDGTEVEVSNACGMRGLPMDFPDDRAARKLNDAFMFGPASGGRSGPKPFQRLGRSAARRPCQEPVETVSDLHPLNTRLKPGAKEKKKRLARK